MSKGKKFFPPKNGKDEKCFEQRLKVFLIIIIKKIKK
jgi:hypothetical protein